MKKLLTICSLLLTVCALADRFAIVPEKPGAFTPPLPLMTGNAEVVEVDGRAVIRAAGDKFQPLKFYNDGRLFDAASGGIEIECKLLFPPADGKLLVRTLFDSRAYTPKPGGMSLGINRGADGKTYLWFYPVDTETGKLIGFYVPQPLDDGKFHTIRAGWTDKVIYLSVDGKEISRAMLKRPLSFANFIWVGGIGKTPADVLLGKFRLLDADPLTLEMRESLKVNPAGAVTELIGDDAESFRFLLENRAASRVELRPRKFAIRRGERYYIDHTAPEPPFEVTAEADGLLTLALPPVYRGTFCVSPAGRGNLLADFDASWRSRSVSEAPKQTLDLVPAERIAVVAADAPADRIVCASGELLLEKNSRQNRLVSDSAPVAVEPGKRYLADAFYRVERGDSQCAPSLVIRLLRNGTVAKTANIRHDLSFPSFRAGAEEWRYAFESISVPDAWKGDKVEAVLGFELDGTPGAIRWRKPALRLAPVPARHVGKMPEPLPAPDLAAVAAVQAKRPIQEPRVVRHHGVPTLELNGKPVPFVPLYTENAGQTADAVRRGIDTFVVGIPVNYWENKPLSIWKGKETYDFALLDKHLASILAQAPDAKLILSTTGLAYKDFALDVPDSRWVNGAGKSDLRFFNNVPERAYSLSSPEVRREIGKFMEKLGEHLAASPYGRAVIGIQLTGGSDGQWYPPEHPWHFKTFDYSEGTRLALVEALRAMYHNDLAALRKAWHDPAVTFESVKLPTPAEFAPAHLLLDAANGSDRRLIDCTQAYYRALVGGIESFAAAFKRGMKRPVLAFTYAPGNIIFDRGALYSSPVLDGFIALPGYLRSRAPGGAPSGSDQATGSIRLHNKLYLQEVDFRSEYSDFQDRARRRWLGMGNGLAEFENTVLRTLGAQYAVGCYGWFRPIGQRSAGTWLGEFGAILGTAQNFGALAQKTEPVSTPLQVAVFFDDREQAYLSNKNRFDHFANYVATAMPGLTRSGLSTDWYLLRDLPNPGRQPAKIHIFSSCTSLSENEIDYIAKNLQRDGNILVFGPGVAGANPAQFERNIARLTGMTVKSSPARLCDYTADFRKTGHRAGADLPGNSLWMREFTGPLFYVDDPAAEVVAAHGTAPLAAVAIKRHANWTAVFIGNSVERSLTSGLLRQLAEDAGIVPVGPRDDYTVCGNGVLMIHAATAGEKTLNWGTPATLVDARTNTPVFTNATRGTIPMTFGETRLFLLRK